MKNGRSFIKGAIILGLSGILAKFLGLFFRWPVTMLIGDEGIGIYQLAYPIYTFIIGIMSGFPIAISRMISEKLALNNKAQAYSIFKNSLIVLMLIGGGLSVSLYLSAPYLIKWLRWRGDAYYSLISIAAAPFFVSIMSCFRGYFQGMQMMALPAGSQVVEQLGRVVVGVGLTYLLMPYGIGLSAAGASFGACAGAISGCILLIAGFMKRRKELIPRITCDRSGSTQNSIRELLSIAVPISIGMTVGSMMSLIDSIIVPARLLSAGFSEKVATELYGQLTGKAHVLINVPLTFSVALSTSLVPAMSEVKALRNINKIKTRAEKALKVSILLAFPSSIGLYILSNPILKLIFPGRSGGGELLQLLSISIIFIVIGQTMIGVLHGVGNISAPVKNLVIGSLFKLLFAYVLTAMPSLNIKGAAISSIIGYGVATFLNFKDAMKSAYFNVDFDRMVLRPLLSAIGMGAAVYMTYNKSMSFYESNGIATMISITAGIIIYMIMLILFGSITLKELYLIMKGYKMDSGYRKG